MAVRDEFDRTTCGCRRCQLPCETMPGALAPGDLELIAEHLGEKPDGEFALKYFEASEGAMVWTLGRVFRVPSIVPARKADGSCVFLKEGRCEIHPVAPSGCALTDMHMSDKEYEPRSQAIVRAQIEGLKSRQGVDFESLAVLVGAGKLAPPLEERRGKLHQLEQEYLKGNDGQEKTSK